MFEKIECEWPLFFCYLILDYCFQKDTETANFYVDALEKVKKNLRIVKVLYLFIVYQNNSFYELHIIMH